MTPTACYLLFLWLMLLSSVSMASYPSACTSASSHPQLLTCRGISRSDWISLAGLPEPVWTSLLVQDSPQLALEIGSASGSSLWSELSVGWRMQLESLAIKDSRLVSMATESTGKPVLVKFPRLEALDLSGNRLATIGNQAGLASLSAPSLRSLQLGGNNLTELTSNDADLIGRQFPRLRLIDFSQSLLLKRVAFGFADSLLPKLRELRDLRFNGCTRLARWEWAPALRRLLSVGGSISVRNTPGWNCTCESAWLAELPAASHTGAVCSEPVGLRGRQISGVNFTQDPLLGCSSPRIANFSDKAGYAVGDTARLLCRVVASPPACVTWTTNRGENVNMKPALRHLYLSLSDTHTNTFHSEHQWHWDSQYSGAKANEGVESDRILVLRDASLYIDYVTRADAGLYACSADNGIGPGPVHKELVFTLKYEVLREVKKYGIIVGASCAASLLGIGFVIGLIRLIVRKCSEEEREKQKSIKEMLEHLESYRGVKMEQFKECKDWLRTCGSNQMGNHNSRVGKVKEACINNMLNMQESYNRRIAKIRDHCDCQIDRLRDSYNSQMGRIKDYRSNQVERVRDQYNQQLLRIKEYAATQLDRLREQYKAQQAYVIRVLDSVSIDNCVTGSGVETAMDGRDFAELDLDITPDLSDSDDVEAAGPSSSSRSRRSRRYHRARPYDLDAAEAAAAAFDNVDEEDEALEDFMTATDGALSLDRLDRLDEDQESVDDGEAVARQEVVQVEVLPAPRHASSAVSLPELVTET